MTPEQKLLSIIERYRAGEALEDLGAEFGAHKSTIGAFLALARKCGVDLKKRTAVNMKEVWRIYYAHKAAEARAEAAE